MTGDEVEPAGTRGFVQARFLVIGCCHRPLPVRPPKIRHSPENAIGPRLTEHGFAVARLIVAASDKSPNGHAGCLARLDAADAVLDHEGAAGGPPHPLRGAKKKGPRGALPLPPPRGAQPPARKTRADRHPKREADTRHM